jgi:hypothetical protein
MFQPLRVKRHADPVVPDNLDQAASGPSKNVQIASVRVPTERFLDLQRQAVHALAHLWTPLAVQGLSAIAAADPVLAVAIYPAFSDDAVVWPW